MKKPDECPKYLLYLKNRTAKILRKRARRKKEIKQERRALQGKSDFKRKEIKKFRNYQTVSAPKIFSVLTNTEKTIGFINALEASLKKNKQVFVDLSRVESIDYGAITVLLSVMIIFKTQGIQFNGNFPNNLDVRKKLVDSQFFDRLEKYTIKKSDYTIKKQNQIFTKSNQEVEPTLGLNVIQEASQTIWNEKRMCKGIQRVLLELMQNTHNHASLNTTDKEYWWLSVNHDKENKKVSFVFVDYGQGIFESLNNKPDGSKWRNYYEKIKQKLTNGNNAEILEKLLNGELHLTVTGQSFRGKGLPGIKQVMDRNQISNLHIISNNVFSNVALSRYEQLNKILNGTFVYWELCYNNENKIWNI